MTGSHGANHGRAAGSFLVSGGWVSSGSVARAPSLTHELVVLQQPNGELLEDVVERSVVTGGWLDAEIDDSFPASDPLSHWAGPRRRESEADQPHGRVVDHRPVGDTHVRPHPEEPQPGTRVQ
jgi:hypothetical protein